MEFPMQPTLLGSVPGIMFTIAGIAAATTVVISRLSDYRKLDGIPTFGSSGWLGSWWAGRRFGSHAHLLIQEGYTKYKGLPFKIADTRNWLVIVSSQRHVEELRKAPDDVLSFHDVVNNALKLQYTLGREISDNPYHKELIRGTLTRNLGKLYPEIWDEIPRAFDEILELGDNDWKTVSALSTIQQVVCRVGNRLFVGLPLCRDPDWLDLNMQYPIAVFDAASKIKHFVDFLAPAVVHFMTDVPKIKKRAIKHLTPIIERRLRLLEECGDGRDGRPDDTLSWLLEAAPNEAERTVKLLTNRILTINFTAFDTTSNSFTHALFFLAENPQYVQPLREEVEAIVKKEGWSKASLSKMRKVDSFVKESQRMTGTALVALMREAIKDFTFSDGTFIPKGTLVVVPSGQIHRDDELYENGQVFNPFRFSNIRDEDGEGTKHQFVSTSPEYLSFGHGKYACPGRFFAANEIKSMLAHIVVTYDIKLEENKTRPEGLRYGTALLPDPSAKVMFRKRAY